MNTRRRTQRQNSNIFEMLKKQQIVELREAFNILDTNSDTVVCKSDLITFNSSIGAPFTPADIDEMMNEAGELSFMMFLTMIGERLSMTDEENEIKRAFLEFSEKGCVNEKELRHWMINEGDKMTPGEVDRFLKNCVDNGEVNISNLISIIKHGEILKNETVNE